MLHFYLLSVVPSNLKCFIACSNSASCFGPSHAPSAGRKKHLSKTEVCMQVYYRQYASSQILIPYFQLCVEVSEECLLPCIFQKFNMSIKLVVFLRRVRRSFGTEYTYKRI